MITKCMQLIAGLLLLVFSVPAFYQTPAANPFSLGLRRNFGYSSGSGNIQGSFTLKTVGPLDLQRVVFTLDGETVGEVTAPPFDFHFNTSDYPPGIHTLSAMGYSFSGQEMESNIIKSRFLSSEEARQSTFKIIGTVLGVILLIMLASVLIPTLFGRRRKPAPLGKPRNYGMAGGTICPKCGQPFPLHLWDMNLIGGKLARCPNCGKWSLTHRASQEQLRQAELAGTEVQSLPTPEADAEQARRELDDSRYTDL